MNKEESTQRNILEAAKKVFQKKGLYGARMQEIADEAGINKAMLHYYFRSKNKLFDAIFNDAARNLFSTMNEIGKLNIPLFEKIRVFTGRYIELLIENPHIPAFVLTEINHNPERIKKLFVHNINPEKFFAADVKLAIRKKQIINIDSNQLLVNIISMCIFPFASKPLLQALLKLNEKDFQVFIDKRKKLIADFIINSIKK